MFKKLKDVLPIELFWAGQLTLTWSPAKTWTISLRMSIRLLHYVHFSLHLNNSRHKLNLHDASRIFPLRRSNFNWFFVRLKIWYIGVYTYSHRLINYIDTKAKYRHLKYWTVKGLCGRCLSEFVDWRYSQSCWYFRTSFVNCCPSITFSLV